MAVILWMKKLKIQKLNWIMVEKKNLLNQENNYLYNFCCKVKIFNYILFIKFK